MGDNQHFATRAVLNKFIHPNSKQQVLYPYSREHGRRKPTGTRQLGSADRYFNQIDEHGAETSRLDDGRTQMEGLLFSSGKQTPSAFSRCVYESDYLPSGSALDELALAAVFLRSSSPVQIHNMAMMNLHFSQQILLSHLHQPDGIASAKEQFGDQAADMLEAMKQALRNGTLRVDVGEEHWKQWGFEGFKCDEAVVHWLLEMGLTICTASWKSFFITSDNPVVLISKSMPETPGYGNPDAELWFPISYQRGLLWSRKHRGVRRLGLGHAETCALNRRMILWCYREVYSPLPEVWIETAMHENKFDPCYGHYGTLDDMMKNHSVKAKLADGTVAKVIDAAAALRSGKKVNVVGF